MEKSSVYSGDYEWKPFYFEHFNVNSIGFYVNGEPTLRPPFKLDIEECDYLQGLLSLYRVTGKLNENTDIGITRESYTSVYTLVGFDVDPITSADFRYLEIPKEGHTRLDVKFKSYLRELFTVIFYATFLDWWS